MPASSQTAESGAGRLLRPAVTVGILGAALGWAYWSTIVGLWDEWRDDPNYSVGQLVPLAALYLLWDDRRGLHACHVGPCWWGLAVLVVGQLARFLGLLFLYQSAERYALVLTVAGLVLLVAGRQILWRTRWVLVFLLLMVPLPGRIHNAVSGPLQRYATSGTVFVLEVLGADVTRAGNVLLLSEETSVGIADACSGLRMLTAFVVVSAVLAFVVERPRWQRTVLLASSIPIAIACNIVRLIATVGLYVLIDSSTAEHFFHDFAGVTMMPLAIAILIGELWLMRKLVVPDAAPARQITAD
jgi:exosortase